MTAPAPSTPPVPTALPLSVAPLLALLLAACGGGGGDAGPAGPALTIAPATAPEGSGGGTTDLEFAVTLAPPDTGTVTVDYATSDNTALAAGDYTTATGTLVFAPGETKKTIVVRVEADDDLEPDELVRVSLHGVTGNAHIAVDQAAGTILNDDLPKLSIDSPSVAEGDTGTRTIDFVVSLEAPTGAVSVDYTVQPGSASDGSDFTAFSGARTLSFAAGQVVQGFSLDVHGDTLPEPNETFTVALSNLVGDARLGTAVGTGTIVDDDTTAPAAPRVSVGPEVVLEGDSGSNTSVVFTVEVDPPAPTAVTVRWATGDESATAPDDYVAANGQVVVPAGGSGQTFAVTVVGDDDVEGLETLRVDLTVVAGLASLAGPRTVAFVVDDDGPPGPPVVDLSQADVFEGDAGTVDARLPLTLSEPAAAPVTVDWSTLDDTALAGSDYQAGTGTVTIPAGEVLVFVPVPVFGDTVIEGDERLLVQLVNVSANATLGNGLAVLSILTDDPLAEVRVPHAAVAEGHAGDTVDLVFTVELQPAVTDPVTLTFETADDTATAGTDYAYTTGTLTILPGDTSATIAVPVLGDPDNETDEAFTLLLSGLTTNATLKATSATGTIVNDDGDGGWQGEELVHDGTSTGRALALRPQVALGPGGSAHVAFDQQASGFDYDVLSRISPAPGVWNAFETVTTGVSAYTFCRIAVDAAGDVLALWDDGDDVKSSRFTAAGGWEMPATLVSVDLIGDTRLAMDPTTGEAFAVWQESSVTSPDGFSSIGYGRWVPGQGWTETGYLETLPGHTDRARVAVGPNGEALAVFTQQPGAVGRHDVVAYRYVAGAWVGPEVLDDPTAWGSAVSVELDTDAAGNAAVTWKQEATPSLATLSTWVNRYDAATGQWSGAHDADEQSVFLTDTPDVAIDGGGNVFVVWVQNGVGSQDLWANRYDAATDTWSGPRLLEGDDTVAFGAILSPDVAADDLGNAIVVWTQDDGTRRNVRAARWAVADGDWGPEELIEELDTGDGWAPHLALDRATGDAVAVWHQTRPDPVFGPLFELADIRANRYVAP